MTVGALVRRVLMALLVLVIVAALVLSAFPVGIGNTN
jgi:hypothetical protein